jgi:hypothetical protein
MQRSTPAQKQPPLYFNHKANEEQSTWGRRLGFYAPPEYSMRPHVQNLGDEEF